MDLTTTTPQIPLPWAPGPLESVSDDELERRLLSLRRVERTALGFLLQHLNEVERRKLYSVRGKPSLFVYCTSALGYSEQAAYKRIRAARLARQTPAVLDKIVSGAVELTTLVILAPHLTKENMENVLAKAAGINSKQLENLVAELAPAPDAGDLIRMIPAQDGVESLSPNRFLFRFTAGFELRSKYRIVEELLAPERRDMSMSHLFERALDALIDTLARSSNRSRLHSKRRSAPLSLRRLIWKRDGARCTFSGPDGARCVETRRLELDHVIPVAMGGPTELNNLRLLCRAHNLLMARRLFGGLDSP